MFLEGKAVGRGGIYGERPLTCPKLLQAAAGEYLSNAHFGELTNIGLEVLRGHQVIQMDGLPLTWRGKKMDQSIFSVGASAGELASLDSPSKQGRKTVTDRSDRTCVLSALLDFPLPLFIFPSQPEAASTNLPLSKAW